jgi:hypothetical protein
MRKMCKIYRMLSRNMNIVQTGYLGSEIRNDGGGLEQKKVSL